MVSVAVWDRFPVDEVMNMLLNYYEGSNEGAIGRETEMRGSMVKYGEIPLEEGGGM